MSRALQINSSPQGWMARNTKPVPLEEKGWVITMKKISIILLSAVLVFSMAACNGGKEKADNQTEKQTESVKPTEEAEMATEAVTEVTTEAGSEETEKDIAEVKDSGEKTDKEDNRSADNETASKQKEKSDQNDEPEQKAPASGNKEAGGNQSNAGYGGQTTDSPKDNVSNPQPASVAYSPQNVVSLATAKCQAVLKLLGEAEVTEQGKASKLDVRMKFLEESSPLGANHPAVKQYNKCMRGAGDTVRSIIISANSRLAFLENKQVLRLLSKDELNLSDIGIGVNGDGETKTALFCVIPDSDKSYNFIIGLLYTQIFQELYYQADFNCGGRLPIHVTFMLDEFANVALPDDYCSLLSTMRSREISSIIIIQNFAQLKALFKDTWETIPGNCDTFIYLGGNEQSTHKYVSELLGKGTIDKKSSGETKGRQGSSSRNYDVLGRELFTPDEVRKLDNKKCIIFIRGFDPIMDNKFIPFNHPMFNQTADGKGEPYVHQIRGADNLIGPPFEILSGKAVKYYEKLKDKGENVYIDSLTYEQFMMLGDAELSRRFSMQDEAEQKATILIHFYPEVTVEKMSSYRKKQ